MSKPFAARPKSQVTQALSACRGAFICALALSLAVNILMLTGSIYMLQVYDRVLASRSIPTLIALTVLAAVLFAFMSAFDYVRTKLMARVGGWLDDTLRQRAFRSVIDHSLKRTPNVGSQPVRDLETIRTFLSGPGLIALLDVPWAPVYLVVCYMFHPLVGLYAVIGAAILFVLAILNEFITRKTLAEATGASLRANSMTEEGRRAAEVLKAMGILPAFEARWNREFGRAQALSMRAGDRANVVGSVSKGLRLFLQSAILGLGAALAIRGEISPGAMIACSILMSRAVGPVEQVIAQWRPLLSMRKAYERLTLALGPAQRAVERIHLPEPKGHLAVEQLTVLAPGTQRALLQGINFALAPGSGLGIIGPTGAGKSTLARALVGLWPAQRGSIRLDGATLEQWQPAQLGRNIGYLPQDVELFAGSVQDNIARFAETPDAEAVVKAAKLAQVHDLILQLADGYATDLGESGARLSAGQRQRIGLARALYGDPALIVLDEPNSNLDTVGEAALSTAIEAARARGATVLVVAHRPSALKCLDQVLFLTDGKQVAFGNKDEILSKVLEGPPVRRRPPASDSGADKG